MVWIYRCLVVGSSLAPTCISFCKSTRAFQTCSWITRTLFNDLLMDYVIRGWKCHFCHNRRYVFWKKSITFLSKHVKFFSKHKTYYAILTQNVSLTKARVEKKLDKLLLYLYRLTADGKLVRSLSLCYFRPDHITLFSSTIEMLTLTTGRNFPAHGSKFL